MNFCGSNGFSLDELYQLCVRFVKEKEGKAFHLSYDDRLQLSALGKQVKLGPFRVEASPDVGWLDVVGNDRKAKWRALGDISRERAQEQFIDLLDGACPQLKPQLEAHLNEKREAERRLREEMEEKQRQEQRKLEELRKIEERRKLEEQRRSLEEQQRQLQERQRQLEEKQRLQKLQEVAATKESDELLDKKRRIQQEAQIRAALNEQTAKQFRQYAAEQHPDDANRQDELIKQLQDQHFQQYMAQVYHQQIHRQQESKLQQQPEQQQQQQQQLQLQQQQQQQQHQQQQQQQQQQQPLPEVKKQLQANGSSTAAAEAEADAQSEADKAAESNGGLAAASMWTHQHLTAAQFKANLAADKDARLKIGAGEVVTVRVPTHEDGNCIVWEFATDYYDVGFGLYFEWTVSPSDKVTVHISDSSDEEEQEEQEQQEEGSADQADSSSSSSSKALAATSAAEEIIPVYRRDCQHEVYCGSHHYPGQGVYLLKFDNSYSLWRSKWLYYRVYYTK